MGLVLALQAALPLAAGAGLATPAALRAMDSTPQHLVLELTVPGYELEEVELGGQRYVALSAAGLDASVAPGQPRLPRKSVLVGVPPAGGWSVRVLEAESEVIALPFPVEPAPVPVPPNLDGELSSTVAPNPSIYDADALYPAALGQMAETAIFRDLSVAPLHLNPFRFNPARRELEYTRRLVVEIGFEKGKASAMASAPADAWDSVLGESVLNYDVARSWRGVRGAATLATAGNLPASQAGSFKIEIDADGMYELTAGALLSAGFPVGTVDPANLHLWAEGQEAATWIEGVGVGNLERLVFYGQAARSRYTRTNVYWLTHDATPGLPMGVRDVTPVNGYAQAAAHQATVHYEENGEYNSMFAESDGDHWYWNDLDSLQLGCPGAVQEYTFEAPHLSATAHTATVGISLQGTTSGKHHLTAYVNGHEVGDLIWHDLTRLEHELPVASAWLVAGSNTLRLEHGDCPPPPPPPRDANGMLFNYFEVGYQAEYVADGDLLVFQGEAEARRYELGGFTSPQDGLVFDITNPRLPEHLTGGQDEAGALVFEDSPATPREYVAVADDALLSPGSIYEDTPSYLSSSSNAADYLLIGYGPFLGAAQPLVNLRTAQGLQAQSIDVQDLYDEFSFGRLNPEAIRAFLSHAQANWQVPPTYVALLGDGTLDYLDHLGNGWHNYLPAYMVPLEPEHGGLILSESASDNRLASIAGDDILPDLFIGRLPVTSVAETTAVVDKLTGYEGSPAPGRWNQHVLFVADDEDPGGDFGVKSDVLYGRYAWTPLIPDRIYLHKVPTQPYEYDVDVPAEIAAAQAALEARLSGGQLLVSYFGHSSTSQWAVEILLHRNQVPTLQNGGRLPVVLGMTCYTSAFQSYTYAPLDERLVVEPTGGSVATWGPTGNGYTEGHYYLARGFLDTVLGDGVDKTLGLATSIGKADLYANTYGTPDDFLLFMIDNYALLGDPATSLHMELTEAAHQIHLPLILRGKK